MAAPPARCASLPVLPDELVEEILLRLPPDDPACLIRASVVCKAWCCAVSHPSFRRRIHELHRTPPVLGFLHHWSGKRIANFVPTTASALSLAAPDRRSWRALDCRHGRALFVSLYTKELLIWEPITGARQSVPAPVDFGCSSAAVLCAADGCDHRDCVGGPFCVVCVWAEQIFDDQEHITLAWIYFSETGTWGDVALMVGVGKCSMDLHYSSVLVGRSLLYFRYDSGLILEHDLARNELTVIDAPDRESNYAERFTLMLAEDGELGLVIQDKDSQIKLWSRKASDQTDAGWVLSRVIYLGNLLPVGALVDPASSLCLLGFAEGANVIFVDTVVGLFTVELLSERVRKVCGNNVLRPLIPVVGFYTPVPRNEQELFDNESNAIKEGTSSTPSNVSAVFSMTGFCHMETLLRNLQTWMRLCYTKLKG